MWKWVVALVFFIGSAIGGGLWWSQLHHSLWPVSWALVASAITTFFVLLYAPKPTGAITKSGMRNAITGTFIVMYFALLGLFVFFHSDNQPTQIASTLVSNFTFLMGVVIAFHFGTTTYEKVAQVNAAALHPGSASQITAAASASETEGTS